MLRRWSSKVAEGWHRVAFSLKFEPAKLRQYLRDHEAVWPEMQQALVDCGWHDYSLFCRGHDGLAVGSFTAPVGTGFDAACALMDRHPVNERWQAAMALYTPTAASPIDSAGELELAWHCSRRPLGHGVDPNGWAPQLFTGGGGRTKADGLHRLCFCFELGPDEVALVRQRQTAGAPLLQPPQPQGWPETADLHEVLEAAGWVDLSLFLRPDDGLCVGFLLSDSPDFNTASYRLQQSVTSPFSSWHDAAHAADEGQGAGAAAVLAGSAVGHAAGLEHYFYLGTDRVVLPLKPATPAAVWGSL